MKKRPTRRNELQANVTAELPQPMVLVGGSPLGIQHLLDLCFANFFFRLF
jgi:hypothetical protein